MISERNKKSLVNWLENHKKPSNGVRQNKSLKQ